MKIYHRWLMSYLPVFLTIVSILIFLFFTALGNYARQQAVKANEVFARNIMQTTDSILRFSEQTMIKEILTNDRIRLFFDGDPLSDPYETYLVSQRVRDLSTYLLSIDSIYLYRVSDQVVLTSNTMIPLEQFADRAFLERAMKAEGAHPWSVIRSFREFQGETGVQKQVISLSKTIPLNSGVQGLIVANIQLSKLEEALRELLVSDLNFLSLADASGAPLIGSEPSSGSVLTSLTSDYSGWTVKSGFKQTNAYGYLSSISNVWYAAMLSSVLVGITWLFLAARRHYRPIQLIESNIRLHTRNVNRPPGKTAWGERQDEFHFIRTAIDELVEHSKDFDKKAEESAGFRRRLLFKRILEDAEPLLAEEWELEMERVGLADQGCQIAVVVFEIDHMNKFVGAYSPQDQSLLKFAVSASVRETGQQMNKHVWCEWMRQDQLAAMILAGQGQTELDAWLQSFCNQAGQWIGQHLPFTVSCGIGSVIDSPGHIARSYSEALEALQYKSHSGIHAVISYGEINTPPQGHLLQYADRIVSTAQAFRAGQTNWEEQLRDLFATFKTAAVRREDAADFIHYFIFALDKECKTLPTGLRLIWEQEALPDIRAKVEGFIQLEEAEEIIHTVLRTLSEQLQLQKQKRESRKFILQIKEYIEAHYSNPDLSLAHISETFQLHMKTVSRLFKEEFGENFVDYVAKVRMEEAKRLLVVDSPDSVQDIAHKVGYTHAITFIRVFKKWEGTTPGDYRKMNRES
ncbi:MAG: hypothetical protein K0Q94_3728 [Paenibacillus sp.]|jgi:AraC-like DNA-binding protein|nr:hypothetical protein [Paenibacillus sp.]